jgi:hypothetical protein
MPTVMGKEKKQKKLINDLPNVFRQILKKYNLSAGDFPEITSFSSKLAESKFSEFHSLNQKHIDELDRALSVDIPKLMEMLPSEKDSPETLRVKMGDSSNGIAKVPIPTNANKFGKKADTVENNPFGFSQDDSDRYWYVVSDASD